MGWKDDLLDASFRGVPFAVTGVTDSGEKSLALYEYPWRSGAEVEDLGRKARRIPVRAVFWGDDYTKGLRALVAAFETPGPGELIHPVFGAMQASVEKWSIEHDAERPDYATISFDAVEAELDKPFFAAASTRAEAETAREEVKTGLADALRATAQAVTDALDSLNPLSLLEKNGITDYLDAVLDVYDAGREVVRSALSWLDYPQAFLGDLAAVEQAVFGGVDAGIKSLGDFQRLSKWSSRLPRLPWPTSGQTSGPIRGQINGQSSSYASGAGAYSQRWVSGSQAGSDAVLAVRTGPPVQQKSPSVSPPALPPLSPPHVPGGVATAQTTVATHAMAQQTALLAEATADVLIAQLDAPTLTPHEVESLTGQLRERIQDCVDYARSTLPTGDLHVVSEGMRTSADALQTLARAALHARPPLLTMTAEDLGNFHLLAHKLYGDYTRADELARLNPQVRNPNFIARGQELFVYAR